MAPEPHLRDPSMVPLVSRRRLAPVDFEGRICQTRDVDEMTDPQFETWLERVRAAPADDGRLELIVRRLADQGERELLDEARLDLDLGLVGDRWATLDLRSTPVFLAAQLTVINTRMLSVIEPDRARWPLAGDQLYVDLDLGFENLPPGSRLAIGSAVIEVSEEPHTGCARFSARFGSRALRWVNSPGGRAQRLRGLNARVVAAGTIRVGDRIRRVATPAERTSSVA